jgi:hypothetical protein
MREMEVAVFLKWLLGEKEGEQWNESDLNVIIFQMILYRLQDSNIFEISNV